MDRSPDTHEPRGRASHKETAPLFSRQGAWFHPTTGCSGSEIALLEQVEVALDHLLTELVKRGGRRPAKLGSGLGRVTDEEINLRGPACWGAAPNTRRATLSDTRTAQ